MCMKGHRHVQQDFASLDAPHKVLDAVLQLMGGLVDFLWIALARLSQLLCCFQQLVSVGVGVLKKEVKVKCKCRIAYNTLPTNISALFSNSGHCIFLEWYNNVNSILYSNIFAYKD